MLNYYSLVQFVPSVASNLLRMYHSKIQLNFSLYISSGSKQKNLYVNHLCVYYESPGGIEPPGALFIETFS